MNIYILDNKLNTIGIIDYAQSVIWTRRYYEAGDFEIYIEADNNTLELLKVGNMVQKESSVMVIENVKLNTSYENGDYLTITGHCIKKLLYRRIIWRQTNLKADVSDAICKLINENAINPTNTKRRLDYIELKEKYSKYGEIKKQVTGNNLYTAICDICKTYGIGWDMAFTGHGFELVLYKGIDRSYENTDNRPFVEFEDESGLLSSEYVFNTANYANTALVAGEGEGLNRKTVAIGSKSGWSRYEIYVDARDLSQNKDNKDEKISDADYVILLKERGVEKLAEFSRTESISGELDSEVYKIGADYNMGDKVQVINRYGKGYVARITEIIECEDENGYTIVPTFKNESEAEE